MEEFHRTNRQESQKKTKPSSAASPQKRVIHLNVKPKPQKKAVPKKEQQPVSSTMIEIQTIRRNRARRKWRIMAAVVLAAVLIFGGLTGFYGASINLFADIREDLAVAMDSGGGYPSRTGIDHLLQVEELRGGFVALGQDEAVIYSGKGAKLRTIQTGCSNPAITVGKNRFCLYSRAGNELRIESRTRTLYSKTTDDAILLCAMASNGSLAVVTESDSYAAEMQVYSQDFLPRYTWHISEEDGQPIQVAFAPDNTRIAVGCLNARDGSLCTDVVFLDDDITARYTGADGTLLELRWMSSDSVLAVFDEAAVLVNPSTGEELARYNYYGSSLADISTNSKGLGLLLNTTAGSQMVQLDAKLNQTLQMDMEPASKITCTENAIYIIREDTVECYDKEGTQKWTDSFESNPQWVLQARKLLVFLGGQVQLLHGG